MARGNTTHCIRDGYMDKISYNHGDVSKVFINADSVYDRQRLYLYTVNGTITDSVTVNLSPQSITNSAPWKDGYGYSVSFIYTIPNNLSSGMYNWENKIFFIVKSTTKNADITIIYPSNTEAAYNEAGGKSLYDFNSINSLRSFAVSFLRPLTKMDLLQHKVLSDGFMKWFNKADGYSVQYICDQDMDYYSEIKNSKIIVVIGHSEYWTRVARLNLDQFVNSGKDAIVLSGNTMWWQVRYSNDKTKLICYKNSFIDTVLNPFLKTIQWTTPFLHYPVLNSIGLDWPHGALPQAAFHGWHGFKIMTPNSPLLAGTDLHFNDTLFCKSSEYDGTLFSGFDIQGDPILDTASLDFCKTELIGYDWGHSTLADAPPSQKGYGTFIVFQKNSSSGHVINTGSRNWCSLLQNPGWTGGFGGSDSSKIKKITLNMFDLLLSHNSIYANPVATNCISSKECCPYTSEDQFEIFPNPSGGKFTIESLQCEMQMLEVYNVFGEKVFSLPLLINHISAQIDLSSQPNGIYFLRINTICGKEIQKLIIAR